MRRAIICRCRLPRDIKCQPCVSVRRQTNRQYRFDKISRRAVWSVMYKEATIYSPEGADIFEINNLRQEEGEINNLMTKQLEKKYLLDHSENNILVHPRNPAWFPRRLNGGPLRNRTVRWKWRLLYLLGFGNINLVINCYWITLGTTRLHVGERDWQILTVARCLGCDWQNFVRPCWQQLAVSS